MLQKKIQATKQAEAPTSVTNFTAQIEKELEFKRYAQEPNYKSICDIGMMSSELFQAIKILKNLKNKSEKESKTKFITLAFTSNTISSGLRKCIIDIMPWVKCITTTTGAIEEDIIKTSWGFPICNYYNDWDFFSSNQQNLNLQGHKLRKNGFNRIGNILVHNSCYISYEQFMIQKFKEIDEEYITTSQLTAHLTPKETLLIDIKKTREEFLTACDSSEEEESLKEENSKLRQKEIDFINKEIQKEEHSIETESDKKVENSDKEEGSSSFLQAAKENEVPVFISAIGDGSLGDIFTFCSDDPQNRLKFKGINGVQDFKEFYQRIEGTIGLSLGDGVITSKMRFLSKYITITSNDRIDAANYHSNNENNYRIIGDMSVILPILLKEVFLD